MIARRPFGRTWPAPRPGTSGMGARKESGHGH